MSAAALSWHLRYNHYPTISDGVIGTCREAIEAVNESDPNRLIRYGHREAQAWAIVEALHLEDFLVMTGDKGN